MITSYILCQLLPNSSGKPTLYGSAISNACVEFDINTPHREAAFLAQVIHETGELKTVEESLRYRPERLLAIFPKYVKNLADATSLCAGGQAAIANRVYANRMGNGSERSGDGWKFHGRGLIQLTGRDNYAQAGAALSLPLTTSPDTLLEPVAAARSAAWFWKSRGLNSLADQQEFEKITKMINGGLNGYDDRLAWWGKCRQVLGV